MLRTFSRTAAVLALSLGAFAGAAQAADIIDHSNSGSSATGSPFAYELATTRNTLGASPTDDSNSASANGNPLAFPVMLSQAGTGSSPSDDSNSASALGGPGTGSRTAPGSSLLAALIR